MAGGTNGDCGRDGKGRRLILNPQSGRCVLRDGSMGRAILARGMTTTTKPPTASSTMSSPSSSANLALAIALASRKRAAASPSPSASPKRKPTRAKTSKNSVAKKKKASPVNNNNNNGYSNSYSPTPRRGRGGIFGLPIKILSVIFAMAVAVKVAQWASTVLHGEAKRWKESLMSFFSNSTVGSMERGYDATIAFWEKFKKAWKAAVPETPPLSQQEVKTYFQECCASKLPKNTSSSFFMGAVTSTVKDLEAACQVPKDKTVYNKWVELLQKVQAKTLSHEILDVMQQTMNKFDTRKFTQEWRTQLLQLGGALRDAIHLYKPKK